MNVEDKVLSQAGTIPAKRVEILAASFLLRKCSKTVIDLLKATLIFTVNADTAMVLKQ